MTAQRRLRAASSNLILALAWFRPSQPAGKIKTDMSILVPRHTSCYHHILSLLKLDAMKAITLRIDSRCNARPNGPFTAAEWSFRLDYLARPEVSLQSAPLSRLEQEAQLLCK